jgi:SAM-dependent methyltransferase
MNGASPVAAVSDVSPAMLTFHEHCPLCSGRAVPHVTGTTDLHYGIDGHWDYQRCSDCRVVFLNPAPTAAFLNGAYDDSYYSYQPFSPPPRWKVWLRRLIAYNPGATGDPKFDKPGRILDIGCGSGEFLYRMKAQGWETSGVELSARAAEIGNRHYGLNIQAGTLAEAKLPARHFDYVRLNHSFEHILDPQDTLRLIHRYLADDGRLFIGVPNVDGIQAKVFGKYWWNLGPPVHPFNYCRHTLTRLLHEHGFELVTFRTNSNFAGVLGSMQMALNDRRGVRADTGTLFANAAAKLLAHWLAKLSDVFSKGDCLEIIARKSGKRPTHG